MVNIPPALRADIARRIRAEAAANAAVRRCPSCLEDVPVGEWHTRRGSPDGLQSTCGACRRAARRRAPDPE